MAKRYQVRKTDANQVEIMAALRRAGALVHDASGMGQGFPDLVVGFRGRLFLLEVKNGKGVFTPDEKRFSELWGGYVYVVRSSEEAINIIFQQQKR